MAWIASCLVVIAVYSSNSRPCKQPSAEASEKREIESGYGRYDTDMIRIRTPGIRRYDTIRGSLEPVSSYPSPYLNSEIFLKPKVAGLRQRALVHWARYMIAAIESGPRSTMYASSSFTRYRKGLSAVASPDFFFPLMRPQTISEDEPSVFFLVTRLISTNSDDAGFSILAAIFTFAFSKTGSDGSEGWADSALSGFPPTAVVPLSRSGT